MIKPHRDGVLLEVYVQPKASQTTIVGEHAGALKIKLKAPPSEGKANQALVAFLAKVFGVSKREVKIERGLTSRRKSIYISGVDLEDARKILAKCPS